MRKYPILLGLFVFGVLLGLFLVSLYALSYLSNREESLWGGEKIAIIEVRGVILDPQPIVEKLVKLRKNEKVKAIVLRIDSPGGGVGPAQEIFAEVKKAQKEKKVLVSMGSVAASGGYYIACAADKILANPGSITGSIGVIVESLNVEELLRKLGLRSMVVKSGKHKDLGSPLRPMTEEEKKLLQGVLDSVHEQFIRAVAEGRKLPVEKIRELADGRIFSGEQARELGLVDELGNLEDTLAMAATLAGIRGEPEIIYPERKRFSLFDLLLQESVSKIVESLRESAPPLNFLYTWPQS
ncbi:MAG: signal peptide peptidase SppA [Deltaproteobacteria bacterium]|jgi:protease IV|nr:signal peptide peptidase SppA [Deltaproteobacteria bacterium]